MVALRRRTPPCSSIWGVFLHRNYVLASDEAQGRWVLRVKYGLR